MSSKCCCGFMVKKGHVTACVLCTVVGMLCWQLVQTLCPACFTSLPGHPDPPLRLPQTDGASVRLGGPALDTPAADAPLATPLKVSDREVTEPLVATERQAVAESRASPISTDTKAAVEPPTPSTRTEETVAAPVVPPARGDAGAAPRSSNTSPFTLPDEDVASIDRVLKTLDPQKPIIVALSNGQFVDMTVNFVCSLKRAKMENYIILADDEAHGKFEAYDVRSVPIAGISSWKWNQYGGNQV